MTSLKQIAREARTVRRYVEAERLSEETVRELVDIARITPCGGNMQPLRYRTVTAIEECAAVFPCLAWAAALKDWPGPAEGERPAAYILICGEGGPDTNTGIAAQTLQLAARDMGYGACMLGSIQRAELKQLLNIPDPYGVKLVVALGKPAETVVMEDVPAGSDLTYHRAPDQIHHVPKLRLEDVLL